MKKINVLLGALLLCSTSVLTSCFSNDIPEIVINGGNGGFQGTDGVEISDADVSTVSTFAYIVRTNVTAHIYVDGSLRVLGTEFKGKGVEGDEITITATTDVPGYSTETIEKTVRLDANGKIINLNFTKSPTIGGPYPYGISVGDAQTMTATGDTIHVKNAVANQSEPFGNGSKVNVDMAINSAMVNNAISNGAKTDDLFTIAVRRAYASGIDQNLNDVDEWFDVMTLLCTPDGAQFGNSPAVVNVKNSNFEKGMLFRSPGAISDAADLNAKGGDVTVRLAHFSNYDIQANAVVKYRETKTIKTQSLWDVKVGNQTYNYFVYSGYDCDYKSNYFINDYLDAKFGRKTYASMGSVTISNLSQRASVPYTITQEVLVFDVYFGSLRVTVNVYGKETLEVDTKNAVVYDATKHSGGAAW